MPTESSASWRARVLRASASAAIILIVVCGVLWRWLDSRAAALAFLRGDELVVIPSTADLGKCSTGDVREIEFRVINVSSSPITLTGVHTSCSCILVDSLPAKVEARASFPLHMTIHSPEVQGRFTRSAVVYTNSMASPQLPIELSGQVVANDNQTNTDASVRISAERSAASDEHAEPTQVLSAPREPDLASFPAPD